LTVDTFRLREPVAQGSDDLLKARLVARQPKPPVQQRRPRRHPEDVAPTGKGEQFFAAATAAACGDDSRGGEKLLRSLLNAAAASAQRQCAHSGREKTFSQKQLRGLDRIGFLEASAVCSACKASPMTIGSVRSRPWPGSDTHVVPNESYLRTTTSTGLEDQTSPLPSLPSTEKAW